MVRLYTRCQRKGVRPFGGSTVRQVIRVSEGREGLVVGIERFENLKSWQEARKLAQIVYRLTRGKGFAQDRGLGWQMEEAVVSAMGNIAEAHGRYSFEDKRRFLDIALGSCKELQSHLYVALDQAYCAQGEFDEAYQQAEIVGQLIGGSVGNLDRQISRRSPEKPGPRRKPR